MATITVPDYALPGPRTPQEPPEAKTERESVWNFLWIISTPGDGGKAHDRDRWDLLGRQDEMDCFRYLPVV